MASATACNITDNVELACLCIQSHYSICCLPSQGCYVQADVWSWLALIHHLYKQLTAENCMLHATNSSCCHALMQDATFCNTTGQVVCRLCVTTIKLLSVVANVSRLVCTNLAVCMQSCTLPPEMYSRQAIMPTQAPKHIVQHALPGLNSRLVPFACLLKVPCQNETMGRG